MKTIEDKAKAYDEAIERAKKWYNAPNIDKMPTYGNRVIEEIFPELKDSKSEDEEIREELIEYFRWSARQILNDFNNEECIAWLEKQGEQKPIFRVGDIIRKASTGDIVTISEVDTKNKEYRLTNTGFIPFKYESLWQLVEQKPADKVEPKFKVGDWIVDYIGNLLKITCIENTFYKVEEINGRTYNYDLISAERDCHSWTIQDAKDGDVLCTDSTICLFKYCNGKNNIKFYCQIPLEGKLYEWNFKEQDSYTGIYIEANIHPATKEQRELLFAKMKEAGYEWDAEKKELRKIEQKPAMIQWNGDNLKEVIDFSGFYKEGFEKWFHNSWEEYEKYVHEHGNIFKIFNEDGSHIEVPVGAWIVKTPDGYNTASRYRFIQKPAWSEEDESWFKELELMALSFSNDDSYRKKFFDWLKSLKDRVQPQPVQEWNGGDLQDFYDNVKVKCKDAKEYDSLFPQNRWKPSEEQIKTLEFFIPYVTKCSVVLQKSKDTLLSLLSDLKKLTE